MNLPNKISTARILCLPIVVVLFVIPFNINGFINANYLFAAIAFGLASMTDFLDGHIARKYNMVTNLGKFLDPIADKVLVVVGLFLIVEQQILPVPFGSIACIIIIGRELIISALRQIAAANNVILAADWWGKIKAVVTDFAIPLLFISSYSKIIYYFSFSLFVLAVILTIISGTNYIIKNKKVFKS
jgi:CDP-diacylglycerol--glycerol-3-phosphate 3-phosphatidyltransferase